MYFFAFHHSPGSDFCGFKKKTFFTTLKLIYQIKNYLIEIYYHADTEYNLCLMFCFYICKLIKLECFFQTKHYHLIQTIVQYFSYKFFKFNQLNLVMSRLHNSRFA